MSEIVSINSTGTIAPFSERGTLTLAPVAHEEAVDSLELSDAARILGRLPAESPVRAEKIARIRQEIQDGTYESHDKMDRVIDRLMDVLSLR